MIKVKATVMYPYLNVANDRFNPDNPKYEVTLANLSEAAQEALKGLGVKVYEKDGMGFKITCKSINSIRAYDDKGGEIDGSIVGNGSEAIAIIDTYSNKYGSFPQLNKLTITKLEEYAASGGVNASAAADLDVL